jgi:CRP-like cAMP-binding protein
LQELPASLRAEVAKHTYQNVFQRLKFFQNKDPSFILAFLPILSQQNFEAREILYREGDIAEDVFFLLNGRVKMVSQQGYIFRYYGEGSYFGESEILRNEVHSPSL